MPAVLETSLPRCRAGLVRWPFSVVRLCLAMESRKIRLYLITSSGKREEPSRDTILRAKAGVHIRCLGRLRPASFAEWQALQIWLFMKQFRIICVVSLAGHHGKMDRSMHYAGAGKRVMPDRFIVPITKRAAIGSIKAGLESLSKAISQAY